MESFRWVVPPLLIPKRIDVFLAELNRDVQSRQNIKKALEQGKIVLNGKPVKPSLLVKTHDVIEGSFETLAEQSKLVPEAVALKVLYEDEDLLIVDKPVGMVVHPGAGNKKGTLVHALLGRHMTLSDLGGQIRPGIVHRLDKDTSGLLVIAKNNQSHRFLQDQFISRVFSKTYLALVVGAVPYEEGHVSLPIGHHPKIRGRMSTYPAESENAKPAETRYRVLERYRYKTLLSVKILTGRTHQIRVHLSHLGYPVVGDVIYGKSHKTEIRLGLHALKIQFTHPKTGKMVSFESEYPEDFKRLVEQAKNE